MPDGLWWGWGSPPPPPAAVFSESHSAPWDSRLPPASAARLSLSALRRSIWACSAGTLSQGALRSLSLCPGPALGRCCPAPQVPVRGPSPEAGLPTGLLSDAKGIFRGFTFLFFSFASLIFSSEVQINSPNSYSEPAFLGWTWGTQKSHHTGQWCFRTTLGKYMHHEASSTKEVISLPGGLEAGSCQGA